MSLMSKKKAHHYLNHLCCHLPRQKNVNKTPFLRYLHPGSNHHAKARAFSRGLYSVAPRSEGWSILGFRKAKSSLRSSQENHWGFCTFKWTFPIRSMSRPLTIQRGILGRDRSLIFPALILGLYDYFMTCKLAGGLEKTVWPPRPCPPLTCAVVCQYSHTTGLHPNGRGAALWHKTSFLHFWLKEFAKGFTFQDKTNLTTLPDRLPSPTTWL